MFVELAVEFGVRGQVRALEQRDMSRCGKAATRRRTPNEDQICFALFGSKNASAAATSIPIPKALKGMAVL
jgi:hypothetical protein